VAPITVEKIAREWADKLLAGRVAFSSDLPVHPELADVYVRQQLSLIESQAGVAAAAWARRNSLDADEGRQKIKTIAAEMAAAIASATKFHGEIDEQVFFAISER
jgi:hypothetical protein